MGRFLSKIFCRKRKTTPARAAAEKPENPPGVREFFIDRHGHFKKET
jgi:hypothetical protein